VTVDVHVLTGAYVLDAVTDHEHRVFERHLAGCDHCTREVAELRATATRLGLAAHATPPPHLRPQVLAAIHGRPRRQFRSWLVSSAAAVLLVVCAALGVVQFRQHQTLAEAEHQATAMTSILRAPDAQLTRLATDQGRLTLVTSRSEDRLLLLTADLGPAPAGHTYEVWLIDTGYHAAALLSPVDGEARVTATGLGPATHVGVTIEPTGGSDSPTTAPLMTMPIA